MVCRGRSEAAGAKCRAASISSFRRRRNSGLGSLSLNAMDSSDEDNDDVLCVPRCSNPSSRGTSTETSRTKGQQQRIESCLGKELRKRKRQERASKVPTTSTMRQQPIFAIGAKTGICSKRLVVDLFACIGGFSTGAAQAGHRIVLAVDCDETALAIHEANHTQTMHKHMFLGPETEPELVALIQSVVPEGAEWHLHGSPPCTKLSLGREMSNRSKTEIQQGEEEGVCLVDWYLDFVDRMNPTSWTMEQVDCAPVRNTLKTRALKRSSWTDFEVVEFAKYGVPQTRTRLVAGVSCLINRIRFGEEMFVDKIRTIRDAIDDIPPGAVYVRSNWHRETDQAHTEEAHDGKFINEKAQKLSRRVDEPAWTIMANKPLQWWDERYARIRNMNIVETLALQSFPLSYKYPEGCAIRDLLQGIGNAVPPLFVRKLMSVPPPPK